MTPDLDKELSQASGFPPPLPRDFASVVMERIARENSAAPLLSRRGSLILTLAAVLLGGTIGAGMRREAPQAHPPSMALFGSEFLAVPAGPAVP